MHTFNGRSTTCLLIVTPLLLAASTCQHCQESVRGLAEIFAAAWRAQGNAMVILKPAARENVAVSVDLKNQGYPFDPDKDPSFFNSYRLRKAVGSTQLEHFKFLCGTTSDRPRLNTHIVFWSGPLWSGSSQSFVCGGRDDPASQEIEANLSSLSSFCVVSDLADDNRKDRCLSGPRCDDGFTDGAETDVDCGGTTCSKCGHNKLCRSNTDCQNGNCLSGRCRTPSCTDGVRNGNESDVDCGGSCSDCSNGHHCNGSSDCVSHHCSSGVCAVQSTCNGSQAGPSAQLIVVLVKDPVGCGNTFTAFANSLEEARSCARAAGLEPVNTLCDYWVNIMQGMTSLVTAPSQEDALRCAAYRICGNCNLSIAQVAACVTQP